MTRRVSVETALDHADGKDSALTGSGFKKDKVEEFLARVENLQDQAESEKGKCGKRCLEIKQDIDSVYDEAKNAGIPKKALKAKIKKRKLEAKIEGLREELGGVDQDAFDMLEKALGELGRAAADKHRAEHGTHAVAGSA